MDNGFNQGNNIPVQPDPNAQAYAAPQGGFVQPDYNAGQNFVQPDYNAGQNFAQQPYVQPQTGYTQPVYDATNNQQVSGWNNYPTNQYAPAESAPVKCPGKEITGLVFGISALLMGILAIIMGFVGIAAAATFGRHSIYGSYGRAIGSASVQVFIYGYIYAIMAIAFAVVTMVLRGQVFAVAQEITVKIKAGFGMAIAGIIMGGIGLFITVIATIVMFA